MQRRLPWVAIVVVAVLTEGLALWSYYYSPSLTVCDLTLDIDEGLLVANVPLVPIAAGESPRTHFVLYRRHPNHWRAAGESSRVPWREVPRFFVDDSVLVAGFGYWLGGWQSPSRPGRFVVLMAPLWAVAAVFLATCWATQKRYFRLRIWMLLFVTAVAAAGLTWLTR